MLDLLHGDSDGRGDQVAPLAVGDATTSPREPTLLIRSIQFLQRSVDSAPNTRARLRLVTA